MKRVYVQMSDEKSCLLVADRLEYTDDSNLVKVFNGNKLVGIFDLFRIVAIYMSETSGKKAGEND